MNTNSRLLWDPNSFAGWDGNFEQMQNCTSNYRQIKLKGLSKFIYQFRIR